MLWAKSYRRRIKITVCPEIGQGIGSATLTENYVLQQLRGQFDVEPRYYSDKNGEIDFVLQYGTEIYLSFEI